MVKFGLNTMGWSLRHTDSDLTCHPLHVSLLDFLKGPGEAPEVALLAQDLLFELFLCSCGEGTILDFLLFILVRRRSLPHKGWSASAIPSGWCEWPSSSIKTVASRVEGQGKGKGKGKQLSPVVSPPKSQQSKGPILKLQVLGQDQSTSKAPSRWRRNMFRKPVHPTIAEAFA